MHLFEIFHNIMSVFTVTFGQFYASLLNKSINLYSQLSYDRYNKICV